MCFLLRSFIAFTRPALAQFLMHARLLPLPQSDAEERIHKVEVENAKLEAALRHEQSKVELLQKELEEARHVRRHVTICFNSLFRRLKFSYFYGMW